MTTGEKIVNLKDFCNEHKSCSNCTLNDPYCEFSRMTCNEIDKCYDVAFGKKEESECSVTQPEKTLKEEINHPDRYAGGKYECIDVMQDVFGKEDVLSFCKLNAFKYIWREKQKNGVQDMKKAAWYINKYIEISEEPGESEKK